METREIRGIHRRAIVLTREAVNVDARTVDIAISSEAPVERWFGLETLGHTSGEVDLSRLSDGGAVLLNHDLEDLVGVVESVRLDKDRVVRGVVRFGRSVQASEAFQDVVDGIRTKISVGYEINAYETTKGEKGGPDQVRVTSWTPLEVSFVSVPADASVGVGRSLNPAREAVSPEVSIMEPVTSPAAPLQAAPVNVEEVRSLAINEALELQALGARAGFGDLVSKMLRDRASEGQIRAAILDKIVERGQSGGFSAPPAVVDLSAKEEREYSIARAILQGATGVRGFEREVSDELAKKLGREASGILVPTALRQGQVRSQDATVAATAKNLVYTERVSFLELLRNMAVVLRAGATYMPGCVGNIPFARQNAAGTATWTGDNPSSAVANSDPTTETFTMSPKQLMALRTYSKQLLAQTSGFADTYVTNDLAAAHALEVDRAAIHGSGASNQPLGVAGMSGVGSVAGGTNGLAPAWTHVVGLETAAAMANALVDNCAYITSNKGRGFFKQALVASAAGSDMIWAKDNTINGYKAYSTNQVSSTLVKGSSGSVCSAIFFGNMPELLVAEWGALDLVTDPFSLADKGLIRVISTQLVDINARHPGSFAVMLDALCG